MEAEGEVLPRLEVVLEVEAEVDSATAVVEEVVHLEAEEVEEVVMEVVIEEATVAITLVLQMKCSVRLLYPISEALKGKADIATQNSVTAFRPVANILCYSLQRWASSYTLVKERWYANLRTQRCALTICLALPCLAGHCNLSCLDLVHDLAGWQMANLSCVNLN